MFAPIEVNTSASLVTWEAYSEVAPFVRSPVIRRVHFPEAKYGKQAANNNDALALAQDLQGGHCCVVSADGAHPTTANRARTSEENMGQT